MHEKGPPHASPPAVRRDERGRLLPGQSLNPGGRAKGLAAMVREAVDFAAIIKNVERIALGKPMIDEAGIAKGPPPSDGDQRQAAALLMERGYGKAVQQVELTNEAAQLLEVAKIDALTESALARVARMLEAELSAVDAIEVGPAPAALPERTS